MKLLGLLSVGFLQLPLEQERSVSFASLPFDLPNNTLISQDALTNNDQYSDVLGPDGRVGCTESFSSESSEEIAVVLAFSKCLDDSSLSIVEEWVNQVKTGITTTPYAEDLKITFQSTMVPGACEERSEKTKQGLADPTMENQGGATPSKNPETTQSPSKGPETSQPPGLLADGVLLTDLKRLEAFPGLGSVVNLADDSITVAEKPIAVISFVTGEKSYGEVVQYEASVQVSKTFNFHICKSGTNCEGTFENCIDLPEVVDLFMYNPFTVTRSIEEDYGGLACKQVDDEICACVWAQVNEFKETCSFKGFATDSVLSVPFPTDGYVANKRDTLKEGREQFAEYKGSDIQSVVGAGVSLPLTFDEVVGHSSSASNLKPLVAPTYGTKTYTAEYPWKEYQVNRVAHIDDLEFTSYGKYKLEVSAYDYFSGATCEGCLVIVDKYRPKATTECPRASSAELTTSNLEKANGLVNQYFDFAKKAKNDACSVDSRRRDFFEKDYTDHDCSQAHQCFDKDKILEGLLASDKTKTNPLVKDDNGCDNTAVPVPMQTALKEWWTDYRCGSDYDARSCEGDGDQTCDFKQCLVMNGDTLATATASITEEAKAESESVLAEVEDKQCEFRAKLSELIDTTESLNFAASYGSQEAQLCILALQTQRRPVTFSNPETKITLEAWTQCGLVRRFFFYVHLHVNSPVNSVSRLPIGSGMCAYPGSDFAELTFDFHPNAGLQYSREELRMKSPEIVTRFAVEMLNKATTEAATDFHVECTFTYTKRSGTKAEETCKRDFSITDCKGPAFDTPDSECEYEACAGQEEVGLYEACGGTVVKADETCTIVETGEKPCCQGCENTEVTCVALLDLPNSNADIMRCEPSSGGAYSSYSNYAAVLLTETAQDHPAAMTLLGATALIAVVALMADDAYYPLLH
ncbi:hypothetical protein GQ600_5547 [Phytophthora cactorum]|nr:hypothetical protein GQ600_5547 [Phytophthora cactorum]